MNKRHEKKKIKNEKKQRKGKINMGCQLPMTPNSYKREWRGVVQDPSTNCNIGVAST
jgi:hypothetical protein